MSKKDSIKEDIATYRAGIMLLLTSIFGVVGYATINISNLSIIQSCIGGLICAVLLGSLVVVIKAYLKAKKILEDL